MTTLEPETVTQDTQPAERRVLHREFAADATVGDGRTIDLRIVPYGETAEVNDGQGAYREEFAPGAFDGQITAAHRVYLNFQHERGIRSIVGKGVSLQSHDDALYGTFRALEDQDGDKALTLIREDVLTSVSLEFLPKRSVRTAEGVIRRVKAHLDAVALCRVGAYAGAAVLAVRDDELIEDEVVVDAELLPVDLDTGLVERCRRLGIKLPQRYEAHPDTPDTPAEAGTSEDGTRQTEHTPNEE